MKKTFCCKIWNLW